MTTHVRWTCFLLLFFFWSTPLVRKCFVFYSFIDFLFFVFLMLLTTGVAGVLQRAAPSCAVEQGRPRRPG